MGGRGINRLDVRAPRVRIIVDAPDAPDARDDAGGAAEVRLLTVYPEGDNTKWFLRDLKRAGGKRPIQRWPDALWLHYSEVTLTMVETLARKCMHVKAVVIFKKGAENEDDEETTTREETSPDE